MCQLVAKCRIKFWTYVKSDTVTTSGAVDLDLASIRGKGLRGVFRGDTTLERKAASRDVILSQAELFERSACGDLDLCCNDIDTRDFFGDSVLDLAENFVSKRSTCKEKF
jgi:hypothetical protein